MQGITRTAARAVQCPACGATAGERCRGARGKAREANHGERVAQAIDDRPAPTLRSASKAERIDATVRALEASASAPRLSKAERIEARLGAARRFAEQADSKSTLDA